ncbi:hypothetical protein H0A36_02800 [Endozoicomonas sp. SM1973]|uniref:Uncharacterized protein n=1 Tax=Spartinivicinus marinus TaxID=2994442 RepID=A0A853HT13_9GAMM|nr:hypothetical protein [Spartinivicinus marinus]MCX4029346.1 hypothetical protein [Spartinivicinus marinus]NYZ64920.1 hypothetical protein [Spartinivicinus marinus]
MATQTKLIFGGVGVVLLGAALTVAFNYWQQPTTAPHTNQPKPTPSHQQPSPSLPQTDEKLPEQLNEQQWLAQLKSDDILDDQLLQETAAEFQLDASPADLSSAWVANFTADAESISLDERITEKQSVQVDKEQLDNKQAGDKLSFDLPGGYQVAATISQVTHSQTGATVLSGHLDGHGDRYPVVVTSGTNSSFATITTPQGSYSLEAVGGKGIVYKNIPVEQLNGPGSVDNIKPGELAVRHLEG